MTITEQMPATISDAYLSVQRTASAQIEYWSPDNRELRSAQIDLRFGKGITARSLDRLPVGKALWVREDDAVYGVFVADCVEIFGGYESKLEFLDDGRRFDERVPVGDRAKMVWHHTGAAFAVTDVQISNVSRGGLQMLTPERVPVGSLVSVTGEDFQCLGTVCYCTSPEGNNMVVGIQFSKQPTLDAEHAA